MTDDFDATLTALLAPKGDEADADAFAASVLRRLDQRDAGRTLILSIAGTAGLAVFAWQLVERFDALGTALHARLYGVLPSVEIGYTVLFVVLLASMLPGGNARRPTAMH
jgi:hypothetical protein